MALFQNYEYKILNLNCHLYCLEEGEQSNFNTSIFSIFFCFKIVLVFFEENLNNLNIIEIIDLIVNENKFEYLKLS